MTPAVSWSRVKELFAAARALPAEQREALLARECGGDVALADEVRALLGAEREVPGFLDTTAELALGGLSRPEPDLREPGHRVGPWVLDRRVGAGGMGTVWRCRRQDDPGATPYAIKFMRRGLDTALLLHRFAMERRTLAALDHANVAALVDAGVDDLDRPFLVMEFVEGEPLDRWCDRRRLGLRERIDLFVQICGAVDHAHRSLVIHRDLKPANILVTDAGVPKLLDFGVARMLAEGGDQDTETSVHARLLTPRYASPEQLRGGHVGTASDVYSLGVILYELLCGRPPFPRREGTILEARADADSLAARPSQTISEDAAELRGGRAEALRRQLRGDLDVIVLTALRPEPARRYPSARHLAEDLERHFQRLPVRARGDSLRYLFAKWSRRHRNLVAMILLLAGVTIGGVAGVARQAKIAREEAAIAQKESASRERVVELLIQLFQTAMADNVNPELVSVIDLAEGGAELLEKGWAGEDDVRARLMTALGRVFVYLKRPDRAAALIEGGLALRVALYGENHLETAESLAALGDLRREQARDAEAEDLLRRAISIYREAGFGDGFAASWAASALGQVLMERERFGEAESWFRLALQAREREYGPGSAPALVVRSHLAAIRFQERRYAEAEEMLAQVLAEQERSGRLDLHLASTLNNYGLVLLRLEDPERVERAVGVFERALDLRDKLLPAGHPDLAASHNNLAVALFATGHRFQDAAGAFRAAANATAQFQGRSSAAVAQLRLSEALSLMSAGMPSSANQVLTGAIADVGDALPADHPSLVALRENSGLLLIQLQENRRAEELLGGLERALLASPRADPATLARIRVGLATARWMQRDSAGARTALAPALEQLEHGEVDDPDLLEKARRLMRLLEP